MRTFVLLLVVANLAYFAWAQWWREQPLRPAEAPAADGLPPFTPAPQGLTLLAELPDAESVPAPLAPDPALPGEALPAESPSPDQPGDDLPAESPDLTAAVAVPLPESPAAPPVAMPEGPAWCAELGLFAEAGPAEVLVPELLLLGIDADLVSGRRAAGTTHWVHSRLFDSEAEALAFLAELQERNIDSFYMREGDLAGRISLGVFSRADSAERMQEMLRMQGYTAEVSQVPRQEARYWLELRASSSAVLQTGDWQALAGRLALAEGPVDDASAEGLALTEKVCDPVASPTQFP